MLKRRIARPGAGRSGGYRLILVFRAGDRAVFVYGFAKSDRENIDDDELAAFRRLAAELLALSQDLLDALVANGTLVEVDCDDDEELQE